jgi:hypothetical protein
VISLLFDSSNGKLLKREDSFLIVAQVTLWLYSFKEKIKVEKGK